MAWVVGTETRSTGVLAGSDHGGYARFNLAN